MRHPCPVSRRRAPAVTVVFVQRLKGADPALTHTRRTQLLRRPRSHGPALRQRRPVGRRRASAPRSPNMDGRLLFFVFVSVSVSVILFVGLCCVCV